MSLDVGLTIDWQKDNLNFTLADFISRLFITGLLVGVFDFDFDSKLLLSLLMRCCCQCVVAVSVNALLLLRTLTVSCPSQKKFYTGTFLRRAKPEQPTMST